MGCVSLNILMLDGDLTGRVKLSMQLHGIEAIKVPVNLISDSSNMEELKTSGVYILVGNGKIYAGQASERQNKTSFISRWNEHLRNGKTWYDTAIAFYSTNKDGFDATDLNWLEAELIKSLSNISDYKYENGNHPSGGKITASKAAYLNSVFEDIKEKLAKLRFVENKFGFLRWKFFEATEVILCVLRSC